MPRTSSLHAGTASIPAGPREACTLTPHSGTARLSSFTAVAATAWCCPVTPSLPGSAHADPATEPSTRPPPHSSSVHSFRAVAVAFATRQDDRRTWQAADPAPAQGMSPSLHLHFTSHCSYIPPIQSRQISLNHATNNAANSGSARRRDRFREYVGDYRGCLPRNPHQECFEAIVRRAVSPRLPHCLEEEGRRSVPKRPRV